MTVSAFVYHLTGKGFEWLMRAAAPFHPKARQWTEGRKGLIGRLRSELPPLIGGRPVAWFHAASLGEFEQGRPVIEAFRSRYPDYFIFLTFFSPSGYELRKNYAGVDYVAYLPADTPANARALVGLLRPRLACFIKYEYWYNYLRVLREAGAAVLSFSALFHPGQSFFKFYGSLYRPLLGYFDRILVQDRESADLLRKAGINAVTVAGDTRFDRVQQIARQSRKLPGMEAFVGGSHCLVVGSAWEADRAVLAPALASLGIPVKVLVAPHEIHERELVRWEEALDGTTLRYSHYRASGFDARLAEGANCLLIDNVGMLSSLYRYGHVAYIGGAFGAGLHNILEAATFGVPVLFGNKNYAGFREANELLAMRGAWAVGDAGEVRMKLTELLGNPEERRRSGAVGREYVRARTGASQAVLDCIATYLRPST